MSHYLVVWDEPANINDTEIDHYKLTVREQEKIVHASTREKLIQTDKDVNITLAAIDICGKKSDLDRYMIKYSGPTVYTCTTQETYTSPENKCTYPNSTFNDADNMTLLLYLTLALMTLNILLSIMVVVVMVAVLCKYYRTRKQHKVSIIKLCME